MSALAARLHAPQGLRLGSALLILALMLGALLAARRLTPSLLPAATAVRLEQAVPQTFGGWAAQASPLLQVGLVAQPATGEDPAEQGTRDYDQVVMRTYANAQGESVMLALAYIGAQRQELKIHRPEQCYRAQGFDVLGLQPHAWPQASSPGAGPAPAGKRMRVQAGARDEIVSYWIRIGELFSESPVQTRLHMLRLGLGGRLTDGVLVRASQLVSAQASVAEVERAYQVQEAFLAELVQATSAPGRALLLHGPPPSAQPSRQR
jgi:EpsI family protein